MTARWVTVSLTQCELDTPPADLVGLNGYMGAKARAVDNGGVHYC